MIKKLWIFLTRQLPYHVRPETPLPVLIAGLVEAIGRDGTRVVLITADQDRIVLLNGSSDSHGLFRGEISRCYDGVELTLRIHDAGWVGEQSNTVVPEPYGLFHPAKLRKDMVFREGAGAADHDGDTDYWQRWNENDRHIQAVKVIHEEVRKRRRGNIFMWIFEIILSLASVVALSFVAPVAAIPLGLIVWTALHFYVSPRAAGN